MREQCYRYYQKLDTLEDLVTSAKFFVVSVLINPLFFLVSLQPIYAENCNYKNY